MEKSSKNPFMLWQILLATAYAGFAVTFLVIFAFFAKEIINSLVDHDYTGQFTYLVLFGSIALIGIFTQAKLAVAILQRSKQVALLSWIDLIAGFGRTLIVGAWIWNLRRALPVYFFYIDACACENYRPITEYHPLDQYYYLIQYSLGAVIFLALAILPLWFYNRSRLIQQAFH